MLLSSAPLKVPLPWANSAGSSYITYPVPTPSQTGVTNGAASFTDGFPPDCFAPIASGGAGPFGKDFNGLMKQVTADVQFAQTGALYPYDSTFSTAIGGYPKGSMVSSTSNAGYAWISTADNNTSDPDTGGANWVLLPLFATGSILQKVSFATSTRASMSGTGTSVVTAWSGISFTKVSATSKLEVALTAPSFTPSSPGVGCTAVSLTVGSITQTAQCTNNTTSDSRGETTVIRVLTGVAAGSQSISLGYYFGGTGGSWTTIFCPETADASYFDATTQATLVITEVGP